MKDKNKELKAITSIGLAVAIFTLFINIVGFKSDINRLERRINELNYSIRNIENSINELINEDKLIGEKKISVLKVKEGAEVKAQVSVDVAFNTINKNSRVFLAYQEFCNNTKGTNYSDSKEEWEQVEMISTNGVNYKGSFIASYSSNYDLRIIVENGDGVQSEEISTLDLYSKLDARIGRDINIKELKKNGKIKYIVQISEYKKDEDINLVSAQSTIYYKGKAVDTIDVFKESKKENKEKIRAQLEPGENYWYAIREVDIEVDDNGLDEDEVIIELKLKDSIGNSYIESLKGSK